MRLIHRLVTALNAANIWTTASCCGHKTRPGSIISEDGRVLVIFDRWGETNQVVWQRGEQ